MMLRHKTSTTQTSGEGPRDRLHTAKLWQGPAWLILSLLVLLAGRAAPVQAQGDPAGQLYALINQVRLSEGLNPLGNSALLNQAAQRHADDLVKLGKVSHEGTDGSGYQQRIREARYQAWNDGLMVNEVIWTGLGTAEDAVTWFSTNSEWDILTDAQYREIGIGFADDNGIHYFVVDLGSRPGVLPIFINDGTATTESPQVALRLTNEEAVPLGDGTWIGEAIEVRLSSTPNFDGVPWQPWEPLLPWVLDGEEPGDYAVYVEFRDGADRTAVAEDTIRLVPVGESPPTPTPFLNLGSVPPETGEETPGPGDSADMVTQSPEATPGATDVVASPPVPTISDAIPTVPDEVVEAPYPTWTPLPTEAVVTTEGNGPDWPLVLAFVFQGAALILGAAVFLRRH